MVMPPSWLLAHALHNPRQLDNLDTSTVSVAGCAVLARLLHDVPQASGLRSRLAERLHDALLTLDVQNGDIAMLALAIDGLQASAPNRLDSDIVLLLVRRLVECEVSVGGPYYSNNLDQDIDPVANACIVQCLEWLAAPPANSLNFLMVAIPDIDAVDISDWGLFTALEQQTNSGPISAISHQLLDHLPLLTAALSLHIMRSAEAHAGAMTSDASVASDIYNHCIRSLPHGGEPFGTNTRTMLEQLSRADTNHEITQLAWYYASAVQSDGGELSTPASHPMYIELGAANVFAWAAYTVYDDFLDDEGQPWMLGTANYTFRAMIRQYRLALPNDAAFQFFVEQCLTKVDQANSLEATFYRMPVTNNSITVRQLPDFDDGAMLADRALFHILGPMAVLAHTGRARIGDAVWDHTLQAFRHYLIARQLNDDIHDWAKDLQAGQASYVVVELFRYLNVTPGTYNLTQLMPYAREQFWQHVLPTICETALDHIRRAHYHLKNGLQLARDSTFLELFNYVENSMLAAQKKREQSQALIKMFHSQSQS
jgi:hypothetical protein